VDLTEAQVRERLAGWSAPAPRYTSGVLAKYARLVVDASRGAVTDPALTH
jgi:dihydroxy-acid dehydratase